MAREKFDVEVWVSSSEEAESILFADMDFVSLVNDKTYGIPPVFAQGNADTGETVLYINTICPDVIGYTLEKKQA